MQTPYHQQDLFKHLQNECNICLQHYLFKANQKLNKRYLLPTLSYRKKGNIAGSAHLLQWHIQLNIELLLDYQQLFIAQTVPHELAHLLVFKYFGKTKPHGKEWQWMMGEILCSEPNRTHNFINKSLKNDLYLYLCQCKIHTLGKIRHKKIQNKQQQYRCIQCKSLLSYTSDNKENF